MGELPAGTLTFLFTDIEGSTRAWGADETSMAAALARHDAILHDAVGSHDGAVVKSTGDGIMAVFADADDAVAAAADAQRAIVAEPWPTPTPLRVRMGLHTGAAEGRDGDYFGTTPTRAARVMSAAHGGQVLLSGATAGLVGPEASLLDLGEHALKGLDQPEHLHQLVAEGLRHAFPPLQIAGEARHNLPAERNPFIGRATEVEAVRAALGASRVVTLTGMGGCGKTRLGIEVARREVTGFPDGGWFVDLTTVADDDLVPGAILGALGAPPDVSLGRSIDEGLIAYLTRRHALLVLDNCEHLVDACADLVDEIVDACPGVKVLATSREPLGVDGERAYRVPSLAVPDDEGAALDSDAVQLFTDRARAVDPAFDPTGDQRPAVVEICRRLDGIPLAIELAAARVAHLSPEEISSRLDDRFALLTGRRRRRVQRQATLAATLDWSWELLTGDEQTLLRRLAVFPGGFGLDAVEGICGFGSASVDLTASLVDKSLVVAVDDQGSTSYRMLETMRLYAQERLVEAGEAASYRLRHAEWFGARLRDLGWAPLRMGSTDAVLGMDNVRAAIEWAFAEGRLDLAADVFRGLPLWGPGIGQVGLSDAVTWAATLVDRREALEPTTAAEVVTVAALTSMTAARFDEMLERADLGIELAPEAYTGITPMAFVLRALRFVFDTGEAAASGRRDLERALELAVRPDQVWIRRWAVTILAGFDFVAGDVEDAVEAYESVIAAYVGEEWDGAAYTAASELMMAYLVTGKAEALERVLELRNTMQSVTTDADFVTVPSAAMVADIRADATGKPPPFLVDATHEVLKTNLPLASLMALDAWIELALTRGDVERAAEMLGSQRATAMEAGWRSPAQLPLYRSQVARVRELLDADVARAARDRGAARVADELLAEELARVEAG